MSKTGTAASHHFQVTLVHSGLGRKPQQRQTLAGLGLRHCRQTVRLRDTAAIRGMITKVVHLVRVERCDGQLPPSPRMLARATSRTH